MKMSVHVEASALAIEIAVDALDRAERAQGRAVSTTEILREAARDRSARWLTPELVREALNDARRLGCVARFGEASGTRWKLL